MQHITRFLSDNFLEEPEMTVPSPNRKQQMEERKFYEELEREEITGGKKKNIQSREVSSPRNRRTNSSKSLNQERQDIMTASINDPQSFLNENVLMSTIVAKDKKITDMGKEIAQLQKEVKTNSNIKTFAKRLAKIEKDKDEEIEDIKSHYKGMMENLAKQIQKANERHDNEIQKNTKLREAMDEMRNDMASREQDLEEKILALGKLVKEGNNVKDKLEKKIEHLGKKKLESEKSMQEAYASKQEYADRMKLVEAEFELERQEMMKAFEKEKKSIHDKFHQNENSLRNRNSSIQEQLSETMMKLEDEEQKHEENILRLQRAERSLHEKEKMIKDLEFKLNEVETESAEYRKKVNKDMKALESWKKNKSYESNDQNKIHIHEKMNLQAELKEVSSKLENAQKKIVLLEDLVKQKTGALRRKTDEMESLQNQLISMNVRNTKDERQRDITAVKERRKLESSEAALRKELEDIKTSPEYIQMIQLSKEKTLPDHLENASNEELLQAIQKLQAEKSSLELKLSSVTLRHQESQKELNISLQKDDLVSDALKKQSPREGKGSNITGIGSGYRSKVDQNTSYAFDSMSSTSNPPDAISKSSSYKSTSRRSSTPVRSRALCQIKSERSIFSKSD
jgi:chromosome segregation ATPase